MMLWAVAAMLLATGAAAMKTTAAESILTNIVDVSGFTKSVSFELTQHDFNRCFLFTAEEFTGPFTTSNLIAAIRAGGVEVRTVFSDVIALNDLLARTDLRSRFPSVPLPKEAEDLVDRPTSPASLERQELNRRILEAVYPSQCPKKEFKTIYTTQGLIEALRADGIEVPVSTGYKSFWEWSFKGRYTATNLVAAIRADGIVMPEAESEIKSLNALLKGPCLRTQFPNVSLAWEANELLKREMTLSVTEREVLNRLILEAVYPKQCPKRGINADLESLSKLLKGNVLTQIAKRVTLARDATELMERASSLNVVELVRLNRRILEATYPEKCPLTKPWIKAETIMKLTSLLNEQGIPVCLETISRGTNGNDVAIKVSNTKATAKEILDEACRNHGFKYEEHDGMVNLFPADATTLGEKYPLNRRVAHLKIGGCMVHDAIDKLAEAAVGGVKLLHFTIRKIDNTRRRISPLELNNVSVREAVNKIVKSAKLRTWFCIVNMPTSQSPWPESVWYDLE